MSQITSFPYQKFDHYATGANIHRCEILDIMEKIPYSKDSVLDSMIIRIGMVKAINKFTSEI